MGGGMRQWLLHSLMLAVLGMAGASHAAESKSTTAPNIAIIDVQRILQESQAAQSVQKQLDKQRTKFQSETETEENSLRQAEKELTRVRETATPTVYADREQQLRQRFLTVERKVAGRRKALDQAFTDSMNSVRNVLLEIVQAIAKERGLNLVLVKQQALWVDKAFDITDDVLARLNKKLPTVTLPPMTDAKPSALD